MHGWYCQKKQTNRWSFILIGVCCPVSIVSPSCRRRLTLAYHTHSQYVLSYHWSTTFHLSRCLQQIRCRQTHDGFPQKRWTRFFVTLATHILKVLYISFFFQIYFASLQFNLLCSTLNSCTHATRKLYYSCSSDTHTCQLQPFHPFCGTSQIKTFSIFYKLRIIMPCQKPGKFFNPQCENIITRVHNHPVSDTHTHKRT